jgi:hypothetical protein
VRVFHLDKPFSHPLTGLKLRHARRPHAAESDPQMTPRQSAPTCEDCYFRRHGLCAMTPERPCPTFRAATRTLRPPRQPQLVPLAATAAA